MIKSTNHRVTATIPDTLYEQVTYWATQRQCSVNEYLKDAIESAIKRENGDYDLPTLEQQRLNQLVDTVQVLSSNMQSMEQIVIHGFDSLLGLTRGDNYLLEEEDGDV